MTLFVNLRAGPYGAVCTPYVLSGDALAEPQAMISVAWNTVPVLMRGKTVFLAAHGFNVSYQSGLRSLARLEAAIAPGAGEVFLGVLWPGDWIVPAINYPVEDGVASQAGALLGAFMNRWLASARSVCMLSHSLGARVVLAAIKASRRRITRACITAGAVNAGCLEEEFAAAAANCDSLVTLSSRADRVLEFAYPPGDLLADVLDPDHPPCETALGRAGPNLPFPSFVRPYEIEDSAGYDHSDYFPPGTPDGSPLDIVKWKQSAQFISAALRGRSPSWPT